MIHSTIPWLNKVSLEPCKVWGHRAFPTCEPASELPLSQRYFRY